MLLGIRERIAEAKLRKQPVHVAADDGGFAEEYRVVHGRLGLKTPIPLGQSGNIQLASAIQEEGLACYDLKQVTAYMDRKTAKAKYVEWKKPHHGASREEFIWAWMPLRERDLPESMRPYATNRNRWDVTIQQGFKGDQTVYLNGHYAKPLPLPVLLTMERLQQRVPTAQFFVADIVLIPKPDPFLAVTTEESHTLYVIERWDEPNFRDIHR